MTSMSDDSVSTILCSCKQTRFHIENPNYRDLDIDGLDITVTSGAAPSGKGKAKAKNEGLEILVGAKLHLKAGQRYALVGRNGSGKSTLLRAIAEKLIPGIPEQTRVAILQQSRDDDDEDENDHGDEASQSTSKAVPEGRTVLEEVIDKATARTELEREITTLSAGINAADSLGALRALRKVRHEKLEKQLFILDKDARLRSGMRGLAARKALTAFEKTVAASAAALAESEADIPPETLDAETQEAVDMLADLQLQVEPARLAEVESRARKIMAGLGFDDATTAKPVAALSGGWRMRSLLASALLSDTDILILDEPTNYLDLLGIIWLQRHLTALAETAEPPTLIVVSHDRDFIGLCTDLLILKDKKLEYYHGDLATWESSRAEKRLHLTRVKEAKDKQKAHIQETIARNMREGKKSGDDNRLRQAKMRQKKLDERWGVETNAKGGRFKLSRDHAGFQLSLRADIEIPPEDRGVAISLPDPPDMRFPGALVSLEAVSFRYPSAVKGRVNKPVLEEVTLSVHPRDRVGVLGLNGAGKSTLIRLLVDETKPSTGNLTSHPRLRLGYYSQHAEAELRALGRAEPTLTSLALLAREVRQGSASGMSDAELDESALRGLLGSLGLQGRVASDVPLRRLSGGQLVRAQLARLLWRRPQCLVLDEVTTHLDYETVTALREALRRWDGAVVLVSHDRWFVRGVVEGMVDDGAEAGSEGSDGGDDSGGEDSAPRRREVYRLRSGKLVRCERGVDEFEELMEKRAKKLVAG